MKKLILVLFILAYISGNSQSLRDLTVRNNLNVVNQITLADSIISTWYSDTLVNPLYVRNAINNISVSEIGLDSIRARNDSIYMKSPFTGDYLRLDTIKANVYVGAAQVAGNKFEIQYNNGGTLGSSPNLTWNDTILSLNSSLGTSNMFIGSNAGLNHLPSSINNTILGVSAGSTGNGSDANVFIGFQAGQSSANRDNVYLGWRSGRLNSSGQKNVFLGKETGESSTGSSNIFIGNQAGLNSTSSNTLIIENSSDLSTPLIYGEFNNNYLKFNTDSVKHEGQLLNNQSVNIFKPPHAWMRFADSSVTISLSQNIWGQITNAGDSLFRVLELVDFTWNADTLFPPEKAAHYNINCALSFEAGTGDEIEVRLMSDEGEISKMEFENGFFGAFTPVPLPGYWNVDGDGTDKIWIEVRNTSSNANVDVRNGILTIGYYHQIIP